jgi:TnpA family transposase
MLQRDGHPTALGEAIAAYGRIFKSLHILNYIDVDETYRRDIKHIRNLQEGRHARPARSATARRASCITGTNAASRTSSASSAWF